MATYENLSSAELVSTYNALAVAAGLATVKRFESRTAGLARLAKIAVNGTKVIPVLVPAAPKPAKPAKILVNGAAAAKLATSGGVLVGPKPAKPAKPATTGVLKAAKPVTVASFMRQLIEDGMDNAGVWAAAQKRFSLPDSKKSYPAWYRRDMNLKGGK